MKVAILCESSADEATIRILLEAILQSPIEPVDRPELRYRPGGWPAVRIALRPVLQDLHYNTDAEALVVIADSDRSPVHIPAHEQPNAVDRRCRLCQLRDIAEREQAHLQQVRARNPIRLAVGVAVPCREAWLLCGSDPKVGEVTWMQALQRGKLPYDSKILKRDLYGSDRAPLSLMTQRGVTEAQRLAGDFSQLLNWFPNGFGTFYHTVLSWVNPSPSNS